MDRRGDRTLGLHGVCLWHEWHEFIDIRKRIARFSLYERQEFNDSYEENIVLSACRYRTIRAPCAIKVL